MSGSMRHLVAFMLCLICLTIHSSLAEASFVLSRPEHIGRFKGIRMSKGNALKPTMRLSGGQQPHIRGKRRLWNRLVFIRGGHQSPQPPAQHAFANSHAMSSTQGDTEPESSPQKVDSRAKIFITRFLRLLFKGMTLPFPMLRELGGSVDEDNGQAVMGFPLRECILAIFSYLCLGTISYSYIFEKWSLVDSLYFSVVTFTSVGYGDLTPATLPAKIFTCFFGLSGLAFLGAAISTIGSSLIEKEEQFIKAAEEASRKRIKGIFEGMPHVVKSLRQGHKNVTTTTPDDNLEHEPVGWRATVQKTVLSIVPALSFLWFGGMVMARIEGWKWTDSVYYSIITGSTIGFGDFFPKTPMGRTWGIFFIPLAVAAAGDVLGNVASSLVERRQSKVFKNLMNREISMENLRAMDEDSNGKVSREEYVRFMLTEMGMVDPEEFDELYEQFGRLDVDGTGCLDEEDLHIMAKHRSGTASS